MKKLMKELDRAVFLILQTVTLGCMIGLLLILLMNVFFRTFPGILARFPSFSMGWFDEIVEMMFAYMVFGTSALLARDNEHFRVDLLQMKYGNTVFCRILNILIDVGAAVFLGVFIFFSVRLFVGAVQTTPVLHIQKKWFYLCMPVSFTAMFVYAVRDLFLHVGGLLHSKKEH